ncbi:aminoglycoside phosphotransferase family protein [Helcococcus bovis]|uniref:aminoglycoside phosphotransferase family protein n=1 Tax=Helcococcus bovis TaxID=3153252 RepID=UPI0038BBE763
MENIKIINKKLIDKGWSYDEKYEVTSEDSIKYLLRVSSIENLEDKIEEFNCMKKIEETGINMCKPIEISKDENFVYTIISWIDGVDAEEKMAKLSNEKQYEYGVEAGKTLQKIHSIPVEKTFDWEEYFSKKMERKINSYLECSEKYENGDRFIQYINENKKLLKNRPISIHHGDFHIGNMMIGNDEKLYIIDFEKFDKGDPWEEFNRIVWSIKDFEHFSRGMIDGYFNNEIPEEFWKLMKLYISSNELGSLPWAISYGEQQINVMKNKAKYVLEWLDKI